MTVPSILNNHSLVGIKTYSISYRFLHWTMGVGFTLLLVAGQQFNFDLTESYKASGLMYHSTIGTIVLISAVLLIHKRFIRSDIRPDSGLTGKKLIMIKMAQLSMYMLAIVIPITGLITAFYSSDGAKLFGLWNIGQYVDEQTLFDSGRLVHEIGTFIAIALVTSHIVAAFYHHFILRDSVLSSMIGKKWLRSSKTSVKV